MKAKLCILNIALISCLVLVSSCRSSRDGGLKPEKGPDGTIAYYVEVEASEPGVRIEADQEYVGTTPCTFKVFGDKDGTFHNFGQPEFVVKAYPNKPGQFAQTKVFRTGWWFTKQDRIPKRIYFDMNEKPAASNGFTVDMPESSEEE